MTQQDNGGAAFPSQWDDKDNEGMTLRDWFAGQALAGYCADPNINSTQDALAKASYRIADAMLAARNINKENEK